jgi:ABC-type transport system involved in cytochrome bd biosynthesis fused ATPase/permease subunit
MLLGYVNQFTSVFHDTAAEYNRIVQYNTDVRTADGIEQAFHRHHRADEKSDLPGDWQTLELVNLNFSHRESYDKEHAPQSLHNIHIQLGRGQRVAFIGESGSGKSTLLALLRGLYEPEAGYRFLVDGQEKSLASLNETVTLFPQDPEIFENSIAYNLTLDLPFDDADIACLRGELFCGSRKGIAAGPRIRHSGKRCKPVWRSEAETGIGEGNSGRAGE